MNKNMHINSCHSHPISSLSYVFCLCRILISTFCPFGLSYMAVKKENGVYSNIEFSGENLWRQKAVFLLLSCVQSMHRRKGKSRERRQLNIRGARQVKKIVCLEGISMTPPWGNTFLFHSSQQLPSLHLRPLTHHVRCFEDYI